ncbi:hypothetical protein LOTGIDRAFT_236418 [Lottia gigantea]|uniref:BCL2-associated athanogene 6 n=1 Tax=Lottia gigantea TaxID=225164 RepID=V3YZU9_LOTGI|nr:hypothetical protein LOTGIDRAFT_236418 [Lottia gigantea]ESO83743.1 hypothetical protein LOTGIDRAFT_236418 [Lottia gigantea]
MLEVTVKTLDGQNKNYTVPEEMTVKDFKIKISDSINISADSQRLIFHGKVLQDDTQLKEYDVHGKVIHVVQRAPPTSRSSTRTENSNTTNMRGPNLMGIPRPSEVNIVRIDVNSGRPRGNDAPRNQIENIRRYLRQLKRLVQSLENLDANGGEENNADDSMDTSDDSPSSSTASTSYQSSASNNQSGSGNDQSTSANDQQASGSDQQSTANSNNRSTNNPNQNRTRTSVLGEILVEVSGLNTRLQPFLDRYRDLLHSESNLQTQEAQSTQRICNLVSEALHGLSHVYHSISDFMVDVSSSHPRYVNSTFGVSQMANVQGELNLSYQIQTSNANNQPGTSTASSSTSTSTGSSSQSTTAPPTSLSSSTTTSFSTHTTPSAGPQTTTNEAGSGSGLPPGVNITGGLPPGVSITGGLPPGVNITGSGLPPGVNITGSGLPPGVNITGSGLPPGVSLAGSSNPHLFVEVGPQSITLNSISAHVITTSQNNDVPSSSTAETASGTDTSQSSTQTPPTTSSSTNDAPTNGSDQMMGNIIQNTVDMIMQNVGVGDLGQAVAVEIEHVEGDDNTTDSGNTATNNTTTSGNTAGNNTTSSSTASSTSQSNTANIFPGLPHGFRFPGLPAGGGNVGIQVLPGGNFDLGALMGGALGGAFGGVRPNVPSGQSRFGFQPGTSTDNQPNQPNNAGNAPPRMPVHMGLPAGIMRRPADPFLPCQSRFNINNEQREAVGQAIATSIADLLTQRLTQGLNTTENRGAPTGTRSFTATGRQPGANQTPGQSAPNQRPFSVRVQGVPMNLGGAAAPSGVNATSNIGTGANQPAGTDNMFAELYRGITQQITAAANGNDSTDTISSFVDNLASNQNVVGGEGFVNDIFRVVSERLTFTDLFGIFMGRSDRLGQLQGPLKEFLQTRVLKGKDYTDDNLRNGIEEIITEMESELQPAIDCVQVKEGINLMATFKNFFRQQFRATIRLILNSQDGDVNFGRNLYERVRRLLGEFVVLTPMCLVEGNPAFERMLQNRLRSMTSSMNSGVQEWMTTMTVQQIQNFRQSVVVRESEVQFYIVKSPQSASPASSDEVPMEVSSPPAATSVPKSTAAKPTELSKKSKTESQNKSSGSSGGAGVVNGTVGVSSPTPGQTAKSGDTVPNGEDWRAVVPEEWVPIISQDIQRQKQNRHQPPLSDAYLQGLPAKRRRVMTADRPSNSLTNMAEFIPESIRRAANNLAIEPISSLDNLTEEASSDTDLQLALNTELNTVLVNRLERDSDYIPDRYPNSQQLFQPKKQNMQGRIGLF